MTLHQFPNRPQVHTSDIVFARNGMDEAVQGARDLADDIVHLERILATVGSRVPDGVRAFLRTELAAVREMRSDAESEAATWQEVLEALVCRDATDDRPDPDEAA